MMSVSVVFRPGGIGRRDQIERDAGACRRRPAPRMEGRPRPAGDQFGGDMGVGVDSDNEDARSRLWDEQRSGDHDGAEAIPPVAESVANRIKVLAAM